MSIPRIGFLPAAAEDTASSRLRVFTLVRALASEGVQATVGYDADQDVLVVQKRLDERILRTALDAQRRGCLLVYDVDDLGDALWWWAPRPLVDEMLAKADLVLTATEEQQRALLALGARCVAILRCAVDYYPTAVARPQVAEVGSLRVLWFGNVPNFDLFLPYLGVLRSLPDIEPVVVVDSDAAVALGASFPDVSFVPWSLETFVGTLQSCHVSCLTHDGSAQDRAKSNNRMTTSIVWGVPAIVSATPDYERTAHEARVDYAVVDDPAGLVAAVERLRPAAARAAYLESAQERIWRRYCPQAVAQDLLALLRRYRRGAHTTAIGRD